MRLIAGEAKGRRLRVPSGLRVRPSGARWRESAFGILDHRDAISGSLVLDLFAGTGALGLEALSRGAERLVAVEKDVEVARLLESNVAACGYQSRVDVRRAPAIRALESLSGQSDPFDLVFLDPPYGCGWIDEVLGVLLEQGHVAQGGRVLVEHARDEPVENPEGYQVELQRRYGDSYMTLLQRGDFVVSGG